MSGFEVPRGIFMFTANGAFVININIKALCLIPKT